MPKDNDKSLDVNFWCLRVSWDYYDKVKFEEYIHTLTGFGALHDIQDNQHSHYYLETDMTNKKIRNDLNRYRLKNDIPRGFKPLSISLLRKSVGAYYRYVSTKEESKELWINGMEIPEFEPYDPVKTVKSKNALTLLLEDSAVRNSSSYIVLVRNVIKYYLQNNKTIPMDGILKQLCKTLWLKFHEDSDKFPDMLDRYALRIAEEDNVTLFQKGMPTYATVEDIDRMNKYIQDVKDSFVRQVGEDSDIE